MQLCKHVVAKVTLVPWSVNLTGKRDKVGHGEVTINNARIILNGRYLMSRYTVEGFNSHVFRYNKSEIRVCLIHWIGQNTGS